RVGIIKDGRLISEENVRELQSKQRRIFEVTLGSQNSLERLLQSGLTIVDTQGMRVQVAVQGDYNRFLQTIAPLEVRGLDVHTLDLEEVFMHYYDRKEALA
ncbi:MAG: ABC transporter ATP-binding protein, partial [Tumebacillaceae bacterium]